MRFTCCHSADCRACWRARAYSHTSGGSVKVKPPRRILDVIMSTGDASIFALPVRRLLFGAVSDDKEVFTPYCFPQSTCVSGAAA